MARQFDRYLQERAALDPTWATDQGIHEHDDRLTPFDDTTREALRALLRRNLAAVAALDPEGLDVDERLDLRLWRSQLETELFDLDRRDERTVMPGLPLSGVYAIHSLLIKDFAPLPVRARAALSRMRLLPERFREIRDRLRNPPAVWIDMAIDDADGAVTSIDFFLGLMRPGLTGPEQADADRAAGRARAALEEYVAFLRSDVRPRSTGEFAVGREVYETYLRKFHLLPYGADRLLEFGHEQWRLTLRELEEAARAVDPARTWQDVLEEMKKDHPAPEELLETYRREVARARGFIVERGIVTLPEGESLEVVETPPFERSGTPYAAYQAPAPLDASGVGHFYVTPVEADASPEERAAQMAGHNRFDIPGTVWHEAYPGHHTQLLYAKRLRSKVRALNQSPLLIEGWGLYCEELAHETGYFRDPRERIMQLNWRLQRAARVILDVSLHTGAMSFDDAVAFLEKEVRLNRPQAVASVRAYTRSPAYFMAYLVGLREIQRLRESARRRLGGRFSLREFHDRVLGYGNVPPALIEAELERAWR